MFAKLFDTPSGQLLVTHEYDDDQWPDTPYRLAFRGEQHKGVDPSMTFGWTEEKERDEAFVSVTQERADSSARELAQTVANLMSDQDDG